MRAFTSINELVAGERLDAARFPEAADENLSAAMQQNENAAKKTEKILMPTMLLSTLIALALNKERQGK